MNPHQILFLTVILLGTAGVVLMLRPGWGTLRVLGVGLSAIAFGGVLAQASPVQLLPEGVVFYLLAAATVGSALAAVSLVHPLYCAVCFGLSLVGVSALMAYAGAQFLAAGTLIVYVGAILVVLLFVLMLAHPRGRASYDWNRWEAFVSAATGIVLLSMLSLLITRTLAGANHLAAHSQPAAPGQTTLQPVAPLAKAQPASSPWPKVPPPKAAQGVMAPQHVARIGQHLFGSHWLALQAAGVLLLAALVGAAVVLARFPGPLLRHQQAANLVASSTTQTPPPQVQHNP
ncbi:MAG: NADH-quinone oxidoreductase subunit J [Thermoguttaceae bacterium]|nr:NADH-quinone oxidoreductase subunit J [Thermoguttaceae bacterium]MDW8037460.1 NADH-quinone oxidoreductase subunit J [Thermoguttaceae bacterium]